MRSALIALTTICRKCGFWKQFGWGGGLEDALDVFVEEIHEEMHEEIHEEIHEESVNEQLFDMDSLISQWCSFISNQIEYLMHSVNQTTDIETIELLGSTYFWFGIRNCWIMTSDCLLPG